MNKVKKDELPASLQALSPAEREKQVKAKVEERAKLQQQVAALSKERDTWLQKEEARLAAAGKGDGFDQQVLEAIRTQAASAGIAY